MMAASKRKSLPLFNEKHVESVYLAYPRKIARGAALQAIRKALTKIDYDSLLEAVQAYAEARRGQESQFTPHCSTWMCQERWLDDRSEWTPQKPQNGNGRALEMYQVLCGEVRRVGAMQIPSYPDQASRDAVKAMGGWQQFCSWSSQELDWRRKKFIEAYQDH